LGGREKRFADIPGGGTHIELNVPSGKRKREVCGREKVEERRNAIEEPQSCCFVGPKSGPSGWGGGGKGISTTVTVKKKRRENIPEK